MKKIIALFLLIAMCGGLGAGKKNRRAGFAAAGKPATIFKKSKKDLKQYFAFLSHEPDAGWSHPDVGLMRSFKSFSEKPSRAAFMRCVQSYNNSISGLSDLVLNASILFFGQFVYSDNMVDSEDRMEYLMSTDFTKFNTCFDEVKIKTKTCGNRYCFALRLLAAGERADETVIECCSSACFAALGLAADFKKPAEVVPAGAGSAAVLSPVAAAAVVAAPVAPRPLSSSSSAAASVLVGPPALIRTPLPEDLVADDDGDDNYVWAYQSVLGAQPSWR